MEKPHKKLDVRDQKMEMVRTVYEITNNFPADEKIGLISQMRRAAISIPCDIAEGAARQGKKEFKNFLSMAQGLLSELDTQLELSLLLGYLNQEDFNKTTNRLLRVDKMLSGLIRSLR